MGETPTFNPEEEKERVLNDAELLKEGAEYSSEGALKATDEQVDSAHVEMEKELLARKSSVLAEEISQLSDEEFTRRYSLYGSSNRRGFGTGIVEGKHPIFDRWKQIKEKKKEAWRVEADHRLGSWMRERKSDRFNEDEILSPAELNQEKIQSVSEKANPIAQQVVDAIRKHGVTGNYYFEGINQLQTNSGEIKPVFARTFHLAIDSLGRKFDMTVFSELEQAGKSLSEKPDSIKGLKLHELNGYQFQKLAERARQVGPNETFDDLTKVDINVVRKTVKECEQEIYDKLGVWLGLGKQFKEIFGDLEVSKHRRWPKGPRALAKGVAKPY